MYTMNKKTGIIISIVMIGLGLLAFFDPLALGLGISYVSNGRPGHIRHLQHHNLLQIQSFLQKRLVSCQRYRTDTAVRADAVDCPR